MVKRGLLTLCAVGCLALVAGCGGSGDDDAAPAATLGTTPSSTTTTTLSVEAEVEAAYLHSWDVYADAVMTFDTSKLADIYDGPALKVVLADVDGLRDDNTPARMEVDHDYEVQVDEKTGLARVIDRYVNHSVLLDAQTREPIEDDPNKLIDEQYLMRQIEGQWKVIDISRS